MAGNEKTLGLVKTMLLEAACVAGKMLAALTHTVVFLEAAYMACNTPLIGRVRLRSLEAAFVWRVTTWSGRGRAPRFYKPPVAGKRASVDAMWLKSLETACLAGNCVLGLKIRRRNL